MAHNSYRVHNMPYLLYYYIRVQYVTCAISCGRYSVIGLLVVMSVVVVLVLLLFSFPVDGVGVGVGVGVCLSTCSLYFF